MHFDETVRVEAGPERVFAMLADVQDYAVGPGSPVLAMEKLPPGPTALGTRWREVIRLGPGMSMTMWSEVAELVPDRRLSLRFRGGSMTGTLTYTLAPDGAATSLRQEETMHAVGWLRPLDAVVGRMLRPRLTAHMREIAALFDEPAG